MTDQSRTRPLYGAVEAGGTKFVLAVGHSPSEIIARKIIPTERPKDTLSQAVAWFNSHGQLSSIGIASFGPIEIDPAERKWGHITDTPKPFWANCNIAGYFADALRVPIGFDTDVNAAALGEYRYGAGRGKYSLAYVTIGTGIGGGIVVNGQPLRGAGHLEMGHWYPRRSERDLEFTGHCPYHGDCLEGLISGASIIKRWGADLSTLPTSHEGHTIVADYLGELCHAIFAMSAAEVVVLGGGVMRTPGLIARARHRALSIGGYYFPGRNKQSITSPALGEDSGITGALILAEGALGNEAVKARLPLAG